MEPIRILNVVGRMDRGGIETMIMNVYRNIDRDKVQFDFLAHYGKIDADYNREIRELGGRIYEMPIIKTTEKTYYHRFFHYRKSLIKFFQEHPEYRVIHGHMTNTASIYMPIAKKYGNVTCCIAHSHLSRARKGLSGYLTNVLQLSLRKNSTDYFACSENAGKWIFKQSDFDAGKVKIINNAIDSQLFAFDEGKRNEMREELALDDQFVIGHVGRFYYEKNHDFLIDIFKEVLKIKENSVLLLVGEGSLLPEIKNKVNSLGIQDKVKFLGSREDIANLMQAMDCFVLPSHFEGLPVVGIEAQGAGLPCLFTDVVTSEIDVTGFIKYMSLNQSADIWAKELLKMGLAHKRENTEDIIINRGYDIKETAKFLLEFYIKKHRSASYKRRLNE